MVNYLKPIKVGNLGRLDRKTKNIGKGGDNVVGETMKGSDGHLVGIGTDNCFNSSAQRSDPSFSKSQRQNVPSIKLGSLENLCNSQCHHLSFATAGTGHYHHRPFNLLNRLALSRVKLL